MRQFSSYAIALSMCLAAGAAPAADLPGSKDPAGLKRFEGSEIIHYATNPYDQYFVARGEGSIGVGFEKEERAEGSIVRVVYKAPHGTSSLEVFRNYEQMLDELEFDQVFKIDTGALNALTAKDFQQRVYFQAGYLARKAHEWTPFENAKNQYYVAARRVRDGQTVTIAVFAAESNGMEWSEPSIKAPINIAKGDTIVGVDVVTSRQINYKMVEVKADDMAKALAAEGRIDLYGIYFDIDKTTLKPESKLVLDEVAKLIKSDSGLKLEIAGHTDSTGTADHNRKLSAGRATAVVEALVSRYGIEAARLAPKGYGDTKPVAPNTTDRGRAQNRRVELRKL
jgi:OmpA-OmpF porin, OOP family